MKNTIFVQLPADLKVRVRVAAAVRQLSLTDFVVGALELALQSMEADEHDGCVGA